LRLALLATIALTACGSTRLACETVACPQSSKTKFEVCVDANETDHYSYGKKTCACAAGNTQTCSFCANDVAAYCAADESTCTATFSGPVNSPSTPCAVAMTYTASSETWIISTNGGSVVNTGDVWEGVRFDLSGTPRPGSFSLADASYAEIGVNEPYKNGDDWEAQGDNPGRTVGSATLQLTSLGTPSVAPETEAVYLDVHGTVTASLSDVVFLGPSVALTVTF
jgi:hypothetical protein